MRILANLLTAKHFLQDFITRTLYVTSTQSHATSYTSPLRNPIRHLYFPSTIPLRIPSSYSYLPYLPLRNIPLTTAYKPPTYALTRSLAVPTQQSLNAFYGCPTSPYDISHFICLQSTQCKTQIIS